MVERNGGTPLRNWNIQQLVTELGPCARTRFSKVSTALVEWAEGTRGSSTREAAAARGSHLPCFGTDPTSKYPSTPKATAPIPLLPPSPRQAVPLLCRSLLQQCKALVCCYFTNCNIYYSPKRCQPHPVFYSCLQRGSTSPLSSQGSQRLLLLNQKHWHEEPNGFQLSLRASPTPPGTAVRMGDRQKHGSDWEISEFSGKKWFSLPCYILNEHL